MILAETTGGVRVLQLPDADACAPFEATFAEAYRQIWAEPPYNEEFTLEEAGRVLLDHAAMPENVTLLAIDADDAVVGFGIGVPARCRSDIAQSLSGLVPTAHSFYLAELGVVQAHRGKGLGKLLVRLRIAQVDSERYTHVVLRTSAERDASYQMYMSMGFDDMGVYMEVPSRRVGGLPGTDSRLFLSRVLDPPGR